MKQEYADKMAELCQREEQAKKQVASRIRSCRRSFLLGYVQVANWEQMYRQWMATMERRVDNLQVTDGDFQVGDHDER